jgi:thiol-disulfide isomerase/thioredoxin
MIRSSLVAALLVAFGSKAIAASPTAPGEYPFRKPAPTLQIGDAAPDLKVARWYKGGPIAPSPDCLLVVDCWATWCHWCVAGFPHISELAKAYQAKVDFVAMDVRETQAPAEVQGFVDKQGDRMSFAVSADEGDAFSNAWLKAAGKEGLPTAFILQKGRVMWIGNTAKIDARLLDSILDGSYDVEEARKTASRFYQALEAKSEIGWYMQTKNYETAIRKADEAIAAYPEAAGVFQELKSNSLRLKEAAN